MPKGYKDLLLEEVKELFKKLPPNVRIRVYYDDMGKSKYTLNQLGMTVDKLVVAVSDLTKVVNRIDTRLNYIVQANNLKDLPRNKM